MGLETAVEPEPQVVDPDAMVLFDIATPRKAKGGARANRSRDLPASATSSDTATPPYRTGPRTLDQTTSPETDTSPHTASTRVPGASPLDIDPTPLDANPLPHGAESPPMDADATALDTTDTSPFGAEAVAHTDSPPVEDEASLDPDDFDDYPEQAWDDADSDDVFLELLVEEIAEDPAERTPGIVAPAMPAHVDDWERRVLADPHLLADIAFAVGGPFHLMYPARVAENIRGFRDAFARAGVDGLVYYGKKANKAACVARACAENGAGVDVSSVGELTAALAAGVRGGELMVTGPAKSDDLLWLAVRHGALIAVDSLGELDRLGAIAAAATPARVLLRVLPAGSASRFGMTEEELDRAQSMIAAAGPRGLEPVQLEGFSFHLSGYDAIARAEQAAELIDRCAAARELGHPVGTISIGGGFGVDYVPERAWREFTDGVDRSWFHAGKSFGSYYPYHFPTPGPAMLSEILAHGGLARRLRDNDIRLAVEPGRALLDRAGSTVFRVQGSKIRHADGQPYQLLTVDGTSLSLSEQWFDSEYLPDPVLWPPGSGEPTPTSVGAASCLESDMLSWRRIPLSRRAEEGDLLVYPNTAGYQMDSNESAFHELPIPPKVVLYGGREDRLRWTLDAG
ncbi:Y4yA family PLP-dependent enzyme [Nocardia bhagyanarayanae]|uniref:Diaminopimelate decarboxylase n=1 Tax=Nocardia bhagyanarayanae TaxID=1215925 RepID=A0A543F9X2_9NOCA|nr:Y4yA family PLP-dependent enzyme [Nocardia bhagyanarayanae]TQM30580.1 diaminopimelate decarboxylase [Nocardia bhagyanarayanae]